MNYVSGVFRDVDDANNAIEELFDKGYDYDSFSVVTQSRTAAQLDDYDPDSVADGAEEGAEKGAWIGGIAGLLSGLGIIAIPGLGPIVGFGALANTLATTAVGAGVGAAGGGLIGAIVDLGVDEDEAELYAEGVKRGGVFIVVETSKPSEVKDIFNDNDAVDLKSEKRNWTSDGWKHFDDDYNEDYPTL